MIFATNIWFWHCSVIFLSFFVILFVVSIMSSMRPTKPLNNWRKSMKKWMLHVCSYVYIYIYTIYIYNVYIYIDALCFRIRGHIPNCVRQGLQKTMDVTDGVEKERVLTGWDTLAPRPTVGQHGDKMRYWY
jgi:hypothetical protein